jgi:hypothetical protein
MLFVVAIIVSLANFDSNLALYQWAGVGTKATFWRLMGHADKACSARQVL